MALAPPRMIACLAPRRWISFRVLASIPPVFDSRMGASFPRRHRDASQRVRVGVSAGDHDRVRPVELLLGGLDRRQEAVRARDPPVARHRDLLVEGVGPHAAPVGRDDRDVRVVRLEVDGTDRRRRDSRQRGVGRGAVAGAHERAESVPMSSWSHASRATRSRSRPAGCPTVDEALAGVGGLEHVPLTDVGVVVLELARTGPLAPPPSVTVTVRASRGSIDMDVMSRSAAPAAAMCQPSGASGSAACRRRRWSRCRS